MGGGGCHCHVLKGGFGTGVFSISYTVARLVARTNHRPIWHKTAKESQSGTRQPTRRLSGRL